MSGSQSLTPYEPDAYEVIARAMAESERGRWFLDEHARRNRGSDTGTVLDAIARLESAVTAQRPPDDLAHLRGNLLDMANAISRTKAEIAAISAPDQDQSRLGSASEALDAIVRTTERATSDILGAAEEVQEAAWTLRERGVESEFCDRLDRHATQIYTACSFQDLTAQRTSRIVHTLRYLEDRLASMIAIWDAEGEHVPPAPDSARAEPAVDLCQSDVDRFIDAEVPPIPAAPFLGPTALDDDLAFADAPAEPDEEPAVAPSAMMDGEAAAEVVDAETLLGMVEPAVAAAEPVEAAPEAVLSLDGEEPAAEAGMGLDASEQAVAAAEPVETAAPALDIAAEAAPEAVLTFGGEQPAAETDEVEVGLEAVEPAVTEIASDAAVIFDREDPVLDLAEPALDVAPLRATDAILAADAAEPAAGTAGATILAAAPEAAEDAAAIEEAPAPARSGETGKREPARLDDIDLLSIEEKLALFS